MKNILGITTLFILLSIPVSNAQEFSASEKLELENLDKAYAAGTYAVTANNAWLYYRSGQAAQADVILNKFISLQDSVPQSITFGQWAWSVGASIGDLNVALFRSHDMFVNLWDQQEKMSAATKARYRTSCQRLLEAARRRWNTEVFDIGRDFAAYSNIFCLYVQTLILAGDRFEDSLLLKTGQSQWTRWYNHISFFGIDEFASIGYNAIIFRTLFDIHDFCHDERIQKESREIMDFVYTLQSAFTHPLLKIPVTGISRDYRIFLKEADARCTILSTAQHGYEPPAQAAAINAHRKYPFTVIGKAAISPFIFQSYQLADAAMGSMTGGACFQQQIHCMAAVGKSADERAVVFIQGSNTPINGYTDQKEMTTLCVYNRLPALWHFTQWRGDMSNYRETFGEFGVGLSDKWQKKSAAPGHIVLEAFGYDLHLFPFSVQHDRLTGCSLTLEHRTTSSPRYHPRPIVFDEYVFPNDPDWFGVYVALVKAGAKAAEPGITCTLQNGVRTFKTKQGHQIRLYVAEKGDTKQLFNVDPAMIPLLRFSQ